MTKGYRGYIGSRMSNGRSVPQHIQQLVIRDYCQRNNLEFLLSATEYQMDGSTMILDAIDEDGIVMYSMFQMPNKRYPNKEIHFAAENCIYSAAMEDTFKLMDLYAGNELSTVLTHLHQA